MNQIIYDVAVIGGGPAGYTAALYAARAGLSVLVIEMLSAGGQMATTTNIENYPGFPDGIDGFDLGERMQQSAQRFGTQTAYEQVTALSLAENPKKITTDSGMVLSRSVIFAAGANPRPAGLPDEQSFIGRGVSYCATCDGAFYKGKTVVVLGGGNTAAEDALLLSKLCKQVYLLHRRDTLRAEDVYVQKLQQTPNLSFILNAQAEEILAADKVTGLAYLDKSTGQRIELAVDGIFVAIGRQPATELVAASLQLDEQGYIVADETTQTSLPGVFAAGDVRTKQLRQVITAASDGANAAVAARAYVESL